MVVAATRATLSSPMSEAEAVAVSSRTNLFGYKPEVFRHPVATRLAMFSKQDVKLVDSLLAGMRERSEGAQPCR